MRGEQIQGAPESPFFATFGAGVVGGGDGLGVLPSDWKVDEDKRIRRLGCKSLTGEE